MTTIKNDPLWKRLEAFTFDSPTAHLLFEQRLARENQWTIKYARRVVEEYKRFIYLAVKSPSEVTPSDAVDQVWHLHLTYTRSYWKDLCEACIGVDLHHNPTEGGQQEQSRFKHQYSATLKAYYRLFKQTPPDDIWPSVEKRFSSVDSFARLNTAEVWIIPKIVKRLSESMAIVLLPVILAACHSEISDKGFFSWLATESSLWLKVIVGAYGFYLVVKFLKWLIANTGRSNSSGGGGLGCGGCGGGCGGCGG